MANVNIGDILMAKAKGMDGKANISATVDQELLAIIEGENGIGLKIVRPHRKGRTGAKKG